MAKKEIDVAKWTDWGLRDEGEWRGDAGSGRNWHCCFCGTEHGRPDRGDDVPAFSLRKHEVELPERLVSCGSVKFEFTRNRHKAHFCSSQCVAQVQFPPLDMSQLEDHVAFIAARHALTSAKVATGTTLAAFAWLSQAQHTEKVRDWLTCLEAFYKNESRAKGLEPIYSICASEDPCSRFFLGLVSAACTVRKHKGLVFILLTWTLRCNRQMALFLLTRLSAILALQLTEKEFLQQLKAEYAKNPSVMNSMTKLGNLSKEGGVNQLAELYGALRLNDETYGDSIKNIFNGTLAADAELDRIRKALNVDLVGSFKRYFVAKMLHSRYPAIRFSPVVGPNLSVERESGAFRRLFAVRLPTVSNALEVRLLQHIHSLVLPSLTEIDVALSSVFGTDDEEHSLCEWVKAVRNREIINATKEREAKRLKRSALLARNA